MAGGLVAVRHLSQHGYLGGAAGFSQRAAGAETAARRRVEWAWQFPLQDDPVPVIIRIDHGHG